MSVPESEPQLPPDVCSTPPRFWEPTPPQFLRWTLLLAVRDGIERIIFRASKPEGWYNVVGLCGNEEFGMIPPETAVVQGIPAALDGLGYPDGTAGSSRRPGQGHADGIESGEFVFQVGPGSVRGAYRVRWERKVVAELEITVPLVGEAVARAARHELREHRRAIWGDD